MTRQIILTLFAILLSATVVLGWDKQVAAAEPASINITIPSGSTIILPAHMNGGWDSDVGPWGGDFSIRNHKSSGSSFEGEVQFASSDCDGFYYFEGIVNTNGTLTLKTDLGPPCDKVTISLTKTSNGWAGTYTADYPDNGSVSLSKQ